MMLQETDKVFKSLMQLLSHCNREEEFKSVRGDARRCFADGSLDEIDYNVFMNVVDYAEKRWKIKETLKKSSGEE